MRLSRFVLTLSCAAMLALPMRSNAQETSSPREYRVLMVGNSLIYVNNLPALLRAVGASQGTTISTETYAEPGGSLSQRWNDGHAANALRTGKFDAVVLQERPGNLAACMATVEQRKAPCASSVHAYTELAKLAKASGAKTLIFTVWAKDDRWQGRLNRSSRMIAEKTEASVFNAAGVLRALHNANPDVNLFPEGGHPSTQASLMLAVALYRDITGVTPSAKDLMLTAPLLPLETAVSPSTAMETQPGMKGTGEVTVIPAKLIQPLIQALPELGSAEMNPSRRGR